MRIGIRAAGIVLGAVLLGSVTTTATAAVPSAPVFAGYYDTAEQCYDAGAAHVGEHACIPKGARWALYIYA